MKTLSLLLAASMPLAAQQTKTNDPTKAKLTNAPAVLPLAERIALLQERVDWYEARKKKLFELAKEQRKAGQRLNANSPVFAQIRAVDAELGKYKQGLAALKVQKIKAELAPAALPKNKGTNGPHQAVTRQQNFGIVENKREFEEKR